MSIRDLQHLLAEHPFFNDFTAEEIDFLVSCASNVKFEAGEQVFRQGESAEHFYLLRFGKVAVEVFMPGRGAITLQTLHAGDVLGWSWLVPPYRCHHDARALELTRALAFDGGCLRKKCDKDARLGYKLMGHVAQLIVERLQGAQVQLMDLYGEKHRA